MPMVESTAMHDSEKDELPKAYDPKIVDPKWYPFWIEKGAFSADPASKKPSFSLIMPPPNVTGSLHMGHALVNTLQDVLARWKRMSGYNVLWIPGTDHAGIATQTVVERNLLQTEGKKRADFSREAFLSRVWKWKEKYQDNILSQLRKIGCSCDWSSYAFTMDPARNTAVQTMFKKLFDSGLIYRGDYLVNWDPVSQTALADDEVEYEERQGSLWHFRYPFEEGDSSLVVATTRPETMLGDTAVAVHPEDTRYAQLIGKRVRQPLTGRLLPLIADRAVDPLFGTGVVKVTPAHDPNDYAMGMAHQLPFINILTVDGKIAAPSGGAFAGQTIEEARRSVVTAMQEKGCLVKIDPHTHRVGISYRSKAVIEPFLSKQWFIRMDHFRPLLRQLIENHAVTLIPASWKNSYFHWIDNLRDWCISRQLWWGHRIPVWHHKQDSERLICHIGPGEPIEVAQEPGAWEQDPDVLDTWFSSALWPFATLGWPEKTPELEQFYPISVLITGHDILFFWVARMIALGQFAMGKPPFPHVFLHGLIYGKSYWREKKGGGVEYLSAEERSLYDRGQPLPKDVLFRWEKMSKSKGNIIDPLEIIESYGTDAMRMALCASATQAREIDLDRRRFEEFRNFCNKIWNGARFVLGYLEGKESLTSTHYALEDLWILTKLTKVTHQVNTHLEAYAFDTATMEAYTFFWQEFCSYYVEIAKPALLGKWGQEAQQIKKKVLFIVLNQAIRLLHPMAPFLTEELFQLLKSRYSSLHPQQGLDTITQEALNALVSPCCAQAPYPQALFPLQESVKEEFSLLEKLLLAVRQLCGEMKLPPHVAITLYISGKDVQKRVANHQILEALLKLKELHLEEAAPTIDSCGTCLVEGLTLTVPIPQECLEAERKRLVKEEERLETQRLKIQQQLDNPQFTERAPSHLLEKQRALIQQINAELEALRQQKKKLGNL